MRSDVTRELLKFAAWRCGFPPTKLGATLLSDEGAWRYAIERATIEERSALIVALQSELMVATVAARARMKDQATPSRWDANADPLVIGDLAAVPLVKGALAIVPPAARYSLIRDVAFVCVGISCRAYTSSARMIDAGGREKAIAIFLGPEIDVPVVVHELAHAFHKQTQEHSQAISAQGEEAFLEHMAAIGEGARLERWQRRDELLADATALSWLHAGIDVLVG